MDAQQLVKKAERNLYRIVEDPEFWTAEFCRAFFDWCDQQAYDYPDAAIRRADLALELAKKTADKHARVRAHGLMASAYRMRSLWELSEAEFALAFQRAGTCSCCLADTYRRQGIFRMYQLAFQPSVVLYDKAIAHYKAINDEDGVGRTLISRGISLWKLGRLDEALEHERVAPRLLAPDTPNVYYVATLTNTAHFLATASDDHFAHAVDYCLEFRAYMAGLDGFTSVRVRLSWTHGLILVRSGERKQGLQMLRTARLALVRMRQDVEVLAITADIAQAYCDTSKYYLIVDLVTDTIGLLGDVLGTKPLLERILDAARRELAVTRQHIAKLRGNLVVSVPSLLATEPMDESFSAP